MAGKAIYQGDVLNIYEPFFATNTRFVDSDAPPMPSWLQASFSPYESPAQMVFACNAVFASNVSDPDVTTGDLQTALGSIENEIVSAFNRGLAKSFDMPPDNWAAFPQMQNDPLVATDPNSQVAAPTTYYYVVTAVNVYGENDAQPGGRRDARCRPKRDAELVQRSERRARDCLQDLSRKRRSTS